MTNKQFQTLLASFPDDLPVKLLPRGTKEIIDFTVENIMESSEGAYVDNQVDPEIWDCEDGKIMHKGQHYILINPIIY